MYSCKKTLRFILQILTILLWPLSMAFAATLSIVPDEDGVPCDTVLNGQTTRLYVVLDNLDVPVRGFDLRLFYDNSGLTFLGADHTGIVDDWEYFSYRTDDCYTSGCPAGAVHMIAFPDIPNGNQHPPDSAFHLDGPIAELEFWVTNNASFLGRCLDVGWLFPDCDDNVISTRSGDTLFVPVSIADSCLSDPDHDIIPQLEFEDGCICIKPPPDDRGPCMPMGNVTYSHDLLVNMTDILLVIDHMMDRSQLSVGLQECGDINCDGTINLVDAVLMINYVFRNGPPLESFCSP